MSSITASRRIRRAFGVSSVGRCRLPRCQATRMRAIASAARISASGSGAATTSTIRPSSSLEPVAAAQHRRLRQVEQEGESADAGHDEAAAVALVELEHHAVGRLARPGPGGKILSARSMPRPPSWSRPERTIRKKRQPACKPGSVWPGFRPGATAIPLGRPSPGASSNQPERQGLRTGPAGKPARRSYSVLLPAGLAVPPTLPPTRCALAAPFHPCPGSFSAAPGRFAFCGAIPGVAPAGRYPAPRPYGARTFLRCESGGRPADWLVGHRSVKRRRSREITKLRRCPVIRPAGAHGPGDAFDRRPGMRGPLPATRRRRRGLRPRRRPVTEM